MMNPVCGVNCMTIVKTLKHAPTTRITVVMITKGERENDSKNGGEGMLYEVKRFYYCPFCDDVYDNELEAEWCRDDCAKKEKIWSTQKIVCSACGRYFETEKEFCDHLLGCKGETCATCEHCDLEMRRSGPCREMNGSKVIEACSHFVRALK